MSSTTIRQPASCPVSSVYPGSIRLLSCMAGPVVLFLGPLFDASNGTQPEIPSTRDPGELNNGESAFVRTVLAMQGVLGEPTESQRTHALHVLRDYARAIQDNESFSRRGVHVDRWLASLCALDRVRVIAAAFVRFRTANPNIFQIRAAHRELTAGT